MTNYERAVWFEHPDAIPMSFSINRASFDYYNHNDLADLMADHKYLFPSFDRSSFDFNPPYHPIARMNEPFTDDFGCIWMTPINGLTGTVKIHPLDDWEKFEAYSFPDPEVCMGIGPIDWAKEKRSIDDARTRGEFISRGLRHGHTFLQLSDIRGYDNLMFDMADDEPLLMELLDGIEQFNLFIIKRYLEMDVDQVTYAEDLGMQVGPMISPGHFKKYIKPSYKRLMTPAIEQGKIVHMHSDGDIRLLVDDIIDNSVHVINLQDLVNGIDWIAQKFRGKKCVELDIDRQLITVKGTPQEIDDLIRREVATIGTPQGGLAMIFGLYPGTPIENVKALMDAMEKHAGYFR